MAQESVHPFLALLRRRATRERFDPQRSLSRGEIRDLVRDATLAPSSFNLQHWRFVAVHRPDDRRRLQAIAFDQEQVGQAAVTFILLGDLQAIDKLPEVMELAVDRGALPEGKAAAWVRMAREIYSDPQLNRDEAMRSGSLAAMVLMLAAEARGLASGALSGFDVERLRREFDIPERFVPVMLLSVGHPAGRDGPRQPRLPVDQVLAFDRCREF